MKNVTPRIRLGCVLHGVVRVVEEAEAVGGTLPEDRVLGLVDDLLEELVRRKAKQSSGAEGIARRGRNPTMHLLDFELAYLTVQ